MKRENVIRILKEKNAELETQYGVKSLSLFGSVARDEATSASDVDLIVDFNHPGGFPFARRQSSDGPDAGGHAFRHHAVRSVRNAGGKRPE
jgi:predicted nucleotidyltransferase